MLSDSFIEHARQNVLTDKQTPAGVFPNEENIQGKD